MSHIYRFLILFRTFYLKQMQKFYAMKQRWNVLFNLNAKRTIWIEQEDLGKEKIITVRKKQYSVKIPASIQTKEILRLRGLGRTRNNQSGDLYLHIWLNKGADIQRNLWLSETSARDGAHKIILSGEKKIMMVIPPNSTHGLTIRLKGLGEELDFNWRAPFLRRKKGNLMVKLCVYPDSITPKYGSFEALSTDDMALEGWVYQKMDEVISKIGMASFQISPLQADVIADRFNERGWKSIFHTLVEHLKLSQVNISITESSTISTPGSCQKTVTYQNMSPVANQYLITIHEKFLDNPFTVAAIIAHELCHVLYSERIGAGFAAVGPGENAAQITMEEERTVDLLVFMFKIGEFQLRAAREPRLTFGYFNQDIFERIQVIVSKKLKAA